MVSFTLTRGLLAALPIGLALAQSEPDTGNHPDWPRWCGKVYQPGYPAFEPGGHTVAPPTNGSTYLHLQFKPRYSLYLSSETKASFVVDAGLSPWYGEAYTNSTSDGVSTEAFTELMFSINLAGDNTPLVTNRVAVNATGVEFAFDLMALKPQMTPYNVMLVGTSVHGDRKYTATSELLYLPDNPSGSATKIDNLKGGLLFKNAQTDQKFVPLLPYGYYGTYSGANDVSSSREFVRSYTSNGTGLNAIIALASYPDINPVYDSMDELGLRFMFDLRSSYKNLTETEARVNTIKHHTSLFAYWSADEPDGWQVPFDITPAAKALIHKLDPYHPVAITLNCEDYYFGAYADGGDILMEDVYPIGINSTFSKWGTECNATLGDCGCDMCEGGVGDVSSRLDSFARYETYLGRWPASKFHNPQVFHGEDYWSRDPTADEARVMNALAFNRGATGIFGWTWPGSSELFEVHSRMAAVVTSAPVSDFLLSGQLGRLGGLDGSAAVDAAGWRLGDRMLVSVVNGGYEDIKTEVSLTLPGVAMGIEEVVLGGLPWTVKGGKLVVDGLPGMSTSFVILNLGK
ncbi:hypothetical protein GGR50DRAFT_693656 [Xylaria sp. CBS 124048]|nr:hypothetical protein GGR50DRAFT_693656 [Xylaria sp. CBS 124048]